MASNGRPIWTPMAFLRCVHGAVKDCCARGENDVGFHGCLCCCRVGWGEIDHVTCPLNRFYKSGTQTHSIVRSRNTTMASTTSSLNDAALDFIIVGGGTAGLVDSPLTQSLSPGH